MRKTFVNRPDIGFQGLLVASLLCGCIESNKTRRAAVGPDPEPQASPGRIVGGVGDTSPVLNPVQTKTVLPAVRTAAPAVKPFGPPNHPFKGLAFGVFDLETSDERSQLVLKAKRPYFRIFKISGEDNAHFVWPLVRMDPTMLGVCNDEASPPHPLYKDFQTTYCKPGTSDAVRMPYELAGRLAQTLNDGLVFRSGAFYDGPTLRQRVFPNPHWHELASVCAGESAGTLADWCRAFLADKASHEKKGIAFFTSSLESTAMAKRFADMYGVPVPR
jgi:hypothetical protein